MFFGKISEKQILGNPYVRKDFGIDFEKKRLEGENIEIQVKICYNGIVKGIRDNVRKRHCRGG